MYEYISGKIASLQPAAVVIETASGIGYLINISLNTYAELEGKTTACLLTHLTVREDAWTLYGFVDEAERLLFRLLIGVSGVGAATARIVLSSFTTPELQTIISSGDVKSLKGVKGIGSKTAERIIVDLHDKIMPSEIVLNSSVRTPQTPKDYDEALAALTMLGFAKAQSQKVLRKIYDADPATTLESAIKKALSML